MLILLRRRRWYGSLPEDLWNNRHLCRRRLNRNNTTDVPDHQSSYFLNTEWRSTLWVNDTHPGFQQARGNKISAVNTTFRIPKNRRKLLNGTIQLNVEQLIADIKLPEEE